MKNFEEGFKLGSLEMLAHRKMENPDFSFTQEYANDRVPSQYLTSPVIEGMEVHRMP